MGPAVADVLFGDYNPGGKLPVSVPRTVGQVPIYYNHKNTGRPPTKQDRYTSKYIDVAWTPLYPFGYGLSYTTFVYDSLRLAPAKISSTDSVTVSVRVTNTGNRAGDEVVQCYLRDDVASFTRPVKQLRRFQRITLRPRESRTVRFTLGPGDLALLDRNLRPVIEPGTFTVFVGTNSVDVSAAKFDVVR
jgi:beta-glucosidase